MSFFLPLLASSHSTSPHNRSPALSVLTHSFFAVMPAPKPERLLLSEPTYMAFVVVKMHSFLIFGVETKPWSVRSHRPLGNVNKAETCHQPNQFRRQYHQWTVWRGKTSHGRQRQQSYFTPLQHIMNIWLHQPTWAAFCTRIADL